MKKVGWFGIGVLALAVGGATGYYGRGMIEDQVAVVPQNADQVSRENTYEEGKKKQEEAEGQKEESALESTAELPEYMNQEWIQGQVDEYQKELGWVLILSDEQSFATDYHVARGENILLEEKAKQLFTMEYLVNHNNPSYPFKIEGEQGLEATDNPTEEFVAAYLDYETFNAQYKSFFNKDYDINAGMHIDGEAREIVSHYVYYDNRRPGSNGVQVEKIVVSGCVYDEVAQTYTAALIVNYSERAKEMLGRSSDEVSLSYKIKDGHMVFQSLTWQ